MAVLVSDSCASGGGNDDPRLVVVTGEIVVAKTGMMAVGVC